MENELMESPGISRREALRRFGYFGAGAFLLACAPSATTQRGSSGEFLGATLSTIVNNGLVMGPWHLADALGYFDEEALDFTVEIRSVGATERIRLLSGNQIQMSTTTPSASTNNALERDAAIVALASGPTLSEKCPDGVYLVGENAWNDGVRSMADMKGRKVALFIGWDSLAGRTLLLHARKAGLDPFTDFDISVWNNFGDMAAALGSGVVDIMISQEPVTTNLIEKSGAHPLAFVWEVLPDEHGFLIFMNSDWVAENEEATVRVMKGYLRGIDAFNTARDSGWEARPDVIAALSVSTGLEPDFIKKVQAPCFPADGGIDIAKIEAGLQYSKALGNIANLIPTSEFIDTTFVEEAHRRLVDEGKITV